MLDVVDRDGRWLGIKERAAVHRDGDWHVAFHLWVVSRDGVLLQRRARDKASWPGFLDATAAGHLTAGETIVDGLREVEEELGVVYPFGALTGLGVHHVDEESRPGHLNRELQHVFAVRDDRPLDAWSAFDRQELDGLVLVPHEGFADLTTEAHRARVPARAWDGRRVADVVVEPGELVPAVYLPALPPLLAGLAR